MWVVIVIIIVLAVVFATKEDKNKNSYSVSNVNTNKTNPTYSQKSSLHRTNILTIDDENMHTRSAYFSDGNVYTYYDNIKTESLIGTYDSNGVVYDTDGYKLGNITDRYSGILLTRTGDLERYRMMMFEKRNESDLSPSEMEIYSNICRKTNIVWIPANVSENGGIFAEKTHNLIAKSEYLYENEKPKLKGHQCFVSDENHKIGYGACFICLLAMTGNRGTYADFYCPLGETFVEPY